MFESGWIRVLLVPVLATMVGGPGVACAVLFLWREEILATRRHWGAIAALKRPGVAMRYAEKSGKARVEVHGRL